MAALILFVGNGSQLMPAVLRALSGVGVPPDRVLSNAVLLNIALIVFGLYRHRELTDEVRHRRAAEERARALADRDPLTGCLNRRGIAVAAEALLADCASRGEHVAVLLIDVDDFKRINDGNGHSVGDSVLRICADRIAALLPPRALLARLGGDEFACVVPHLAETLPSLDDLAGRIIERVAQPVAISQQRLDMTVSIGIASTAPGRQAAGLTNGDALLHMADIAMYHAKKIGKNGYCHFDPAIEQALRERTRLEQAVRAGIDAQEFVPHYQPQIDLASRRITGFEMLARWTSPDFADVGPEQFVAVAEDLGLIEPLSEQLLRQAFRDAADWSPSLTLAVNVAPSQLRDPWFAQKLLKMLLEANFPPARLEIEVTETGLHQDIGQVRTLLASLKNQGITISLDDFGSGYSSMAQLQSLPFDRLKIDRGFVIPMTGCEESATIVRAIASLGKGLGLPVTAEGVECPEVARQLEELGNLQAQGFLYGMPASAEDTRRTLQQNGLLCERKPGAAVVSTPSGKTDPGPPLTDVA